MATTKPQMTAEETAATIERIIDRLNRWKNAYTVTIHMSGGVIQQIDGPEGIDVIVIDADEEQEQ